MTDFKHESEKRDQFVNKCIHELCQKTNQSVAHFVKMNIVGFSDEKQSDNENLLIY